MEDNNLQTAPEQSNYPAPEKPKYQWLKYLGVAVLVLAFFALGWFGKDWLGSLGNRQKPASGQPQGYGSVVVRDRPDLGKEQPLPQPPLPGQSSSSASSSGTGQEIWLSVDWEKNSLKVKCPPNLPAGEECYLSGKITSGEYVGQNLVLELVPGLGTDFVYHAVKGTDDTVLTSYEPNSKQYRFRGLDDVPELIDFPSTTYKLKKAYRQVMFQTQTVKWKLFDNNVLGPVYLMENGCIMAELPDHTAIAYDLVIPFVNRENGNVEMTFSGGEKNTEAYQYNAITGCGALCYYLAVQDESILKPQERLTAIGTTSNQEPIYALKDTNDKLLKNLYADKNTVAYMADGSYENTGTNKYTYQQFLSYHPLVYWKDPLGRWIEFKNQRFILAAEMCKPVIYLYPEKQTSLEVKVHPNGGFTYTNPKYENGWQVSASPEGRITDARTGNKYDYLFWEGVGLNYPVTDKGWVVKRGDLAGFLDSKLAELGLMGREAEDFKAYWVKRLNEYPYYKISFLSKEQMDELAPLEISGARPGTVIRMLMTAKGLDKYEAVVPQVLPAAKSRFGFTVVEWGGVVLK